jgi:transcription initiation factor TFIIIB Brf1 subunit/transcription initiation factor TFIIB
MNNYGSGDVLLPSLDQLIHQLGITNHTIPQLSSSNAKDVNRHGSARLDRSQFTYPEEKEDSSSSASSDTDDSTSDSSSEESDQDAKHRKKHQKELVSHRTKKSKYYDAEKETKKKAKKEKYKDNKNKEDIFLTGEKKDEDTIKKDSDTCKSCGALNAIYTDRERGFVTCRFCSSVFEQNVMDYNPEWRRGGGDDGKPEVVGRCGGASNSTFPTSSIGTSLSGNSKLARYSNWQSMSSSERAMYRIFTMIKNKCIQNGLKQCIIDDAKDYWNQIKKCKPGKESGKKKGKTNINRGVTQLALIAACVHFACANRKMPISHQRTAKIFNLANDDITLGCRLFMDKAEESGLLGKLNTNAPVEYIQMARSNLIIGKDTFDLAIKIATNCLELNLATEHMPSSTAAACILLACTMNGLSVTKHTVAKAFQISDVTITKAFKKICLFRNVLYSQELTRQAAIILNEERDKMLEPYKKQPIIPEIIETSSSSESSDTEEDDKGRKRRKNSGSHKKTNKTSSLSKRRKNNSTSSSSEDTESSCSE